MRKVILISLLVLALVGCTQSKPKNISDSHYFGLKVLEIADSVLDFDSPAGDAHSKLDALSKQSGLDEVEFRHANHLNNSQVEHRTLFLAYAISRLQYDGNTYGDVLASRNSLAKVLGKKER